MKAQLIVLFLFLFALPFALTWAQAEKPSKDNSKPEAVEADSTQDQEEKVSAIVPVAAGDLTARTESARLCGSSV